MLILFIIAVGDSSSHFLLARAMFLLLLSTRAIDTRGGNILLLLLSLGDQNGDSLCDVAKKSLCQLIIAWG